MARCLRCSERQYYSVAEGRTRGCRCHGDQQPAPPSALMDFVQVLRHVFLACLPHPIETELRLCLRSVPGWIPSPHLLRLPRGELRPECGTYYFDPRDAIAERNWYTWRRVRISRRT